MLYEAATAHAAPLDAAAAGGIAPLGIATAVLDVKASADALLADAEQHLATVKVCGLT